MRTRIIHFTPTPNRRPSAVVIQDSAPGRCAPRQVVRQASPTSALRLIRVLSRLLETRSTAVDVFLHPDGWSATVHGRL